MTFASGAQTDSYLLSFASLERTEAKQTGELKNVRRDIDYRWYEQAQWRHDEST